MYLRCFEAEDRRPIARSVGGRTLDAHAPVVSSASLQVDRVGISGAGSRFVDRE